ncbi:hypothetical protein [Gloeobacter violaceus]|uniref:Gll1274 protein n=1 Tax=Gloeobacter violaceus (strain ATCC 29082 / PCC 7421) TaxID=251221 RepID=Q7NL52_GLOVI|nr:hypothetical protein [Gloeobacter violaceus]BAC89215.1 gll1274 [Gloeobacter violaceus PCC 7421]
MKLVKDQLVCLRLDDAEQLLLAEVKDIVVNARGELTCWARPLALRSGGGRIQDVRQAPDLLWPATEFEAALDAEVTSMLAVLATEALFPDPVRTASLLQFVRGCTASRPRRAG